MVFYESSHPSEGLIAFWRRARSPAYWHDCEREI